MKTNCYFKTNAVALLGDIIATGSMGQCKVIDRLEGGCTLHVENLMTKETAYVYTSDCDLISRAPSDLPPGLHVGLSYWKGDSFIACLQLLNADGYSVAHASFEGGELRAESLLCASGVNQDAFLKSCREALPTVKKMHALNN